MVDFNTVKAMLQDPEKMKSWALAHQDALKAWGGLLFGVIVVFWFFSDGDFSFLLTLASLISMFGFLMVAVKVSSSKSCKGVSLIMSEAYVVVSICRLCSIIPYEGYLPYDKSGDWLYQTVEAVTFCLAGSIVYLIRVQFAETYDPTLDTFKRVYLFPPALVLAVLFHPSLNAFMPADICWTFALYLESITVLPQLVLFQKAAEVEDFTVHFLAGQALSKLLSFLFWVSSFTELNDDSSHLKSYVGYWVIIMQLLQLVIMGDFIYQYIRCLSKGVSVSNILSSEMV
eukprot:CAMPEP_0204327518 /NCGR_PEP_ID=MMETSP0469-20131031/12648_1 /ASSEMBLY_ACC=CAM_ASM_000384 /TAXON_ID=2969 /ORGANISM="Oxyrrhis marina" /LENGTH=285 /DNA_ID=CAMNT_0051309757 /DNA_START=12 /DNA_END=869 /DNA_ORIENTATION=-